MSKDFKVEFYGHRRLGGFRKRLYIVSGVILISVGLFGLFNQDPSSGLFLLSLALLAGGTGNIRVSTERVKYKNSRQKPKTIRLKHLSDVIIDGQKAEFVKTDQSVGIYDFTGFPISVGSEIISVLKSLRNHGIMGEK
jgi:hypothetical protein